MHSIGALAGSTQNSNVNVNSGNVAYTGGNWSNGSNTGAFYLNVNNSTSNANSNVGAHLISFKNP